ncbi:MAG: glycosyltransferase family 4 protein [Chloroflexi bacterium]|nr:glycosyltransferase family 4 protein [Chloroflexota bacterium]
MPRIGLNAHLLAHGGSYRNAGVSRYIAKLMAHLPQVDPDTEYVAFWGGGVDAPPTWRICPSPWRTRWPPARIAWEQLCQPIAARRAGLHLLHAPVYVGPLLGKCPLVITVHDLSFFRYPHLFRPFNRRYLQHFACWSASRARRIIAVSQSTARDVIEWLRVPEEKVVVVPNGVDEEMRPRAEAELELFRLGHGLPPKMILFLGTLEPRKNIPTLLAAYAELRRRGYVEHTLILAGARGWYYEEIDRTIERLCLGDKVRFVGYVPTEELSLWYSAADLFVYPALYEGFGLPPLEAMACGTPVVVSNVSSLPEVVGEAGLTADPRDPHALAEAMARALVDSALRARLRQDGLARAATYSWRVTAERTAQVYHQTLDEAAYG